jgi:hypothetical protein
MKRLQNRAKMVAAKLTLALGFMAASCVAASCADVSPEEEVGSVQLALGPPGLDGQLVADECYDERIAGHPNVTNWEQCAACVAAECERLYPREWITDPGNLGVPFPAPGLHVLPQAYFECLEAAYEKCREHFPPADPAPTPPPSPPFTPPPWLADAFINTAVAAGGAALVYKLAKNGASAPARAVFIPILLAVTAGDLMAAGVDYLDNYNYNVNNSVFGGGPTGTGNCPPGYSPQTSTLGTACIQDATTAPPPPPSCASFQTCDEMEASMGPLLPPDILFSDQTLECIGPEGLTTGINCVLLMRASVDAPMFP